MQGSLGGRNADIGPSLREGLEDLFRVGVAHFDPNAWMALCHFVQNLREGQGRDGGDCRKTQNPFRRMGGQFDCCHGAVKLTDLTLPKALNLLSQRGQAVLAFAFEKRAAEMIFQLFQRHGYRRLRAAKLVCGIGKVARSRHGTERPEHLDFYGQGFNLSEIRFNYLSLTDVSSHVHHG